MNQTTLVIMPAGIGSRYDTGHAILACRNVIDTPFAIINADDYYGKEAFVKMHNFLINHTDTKTEYCMIGFKLSNTLSENGTVTRGVCSMNNEHYLSRITETHEILKASDGLYESEEGIDLNDDTLVSMNMWGVTPEYIDILQDKFVSFLSNLSPSDTKSEFLLPTIMGDLLNEDSITIKVLDSSDRWFGVTYAEDKDSVINAFNELISKGIYNANLWS